MRYQVYGKDTGLFEGQDFKRLADFVTAQDASTFITDQFQKKQGDARRVWLLIDSRDHFQISVYTQLGSLLRGFGDGDYELKDGRVQRVQKLAGKRV